MWYLNPSLSEYNDVLKELLRPDHGIIIHAESKEDWEILWKIMRQHTTMRPTEPAIIKMDKWGSIENHAISIYMENEWPDINSGWCSVTWYKSEPEYRRYDYLSFSDVFQDSHLTPDAFDKVFEDWG